MKAFMVGLYVECLHEGREANKALSDEEKIIMHCRQRIKGALKSFQGLIWTLIFGDDMENSVLQILVYVRNSCWQSLQDLQLCQYTLTFLF